MKIDLKRATALLLLLPMLLGLVACAAPKSSEQEVTVPTVVQNHQKETEDCSDLGTPLADIRVRQALLHAIDVDTVVDALFHGNAEKAKAFGVPGLATEEGLDYDPEKAKQLLAEAGWPTQYVLDVVYYYDDQLTVDVLNVICSYWEAVGIKSSIRKLEEDVAAQLWTAPENPAEDDAAVAWDLAYGAVAALTESEYYTRFASYASNNSHTPPQEGLDALIEGEKYDQVRQLLAENTLVIPLYHQDCFIYSSAHIQGAVEGNDQFSYEKDILNWTTDREDETLYTNGGPISFYSDPTVNPGLYLYQELLFERLLNADSQLNPTEGMLAESWMLSDDGLMLEFVLREDLMWQDGQPLTAEDVKFTFELYMRCSGASSVLTGVLDTLEGAEAFQTGEAAECTGIRTEENRVKFVFEKPAADALTVFSQWPVLPKHCLEDADPEALQQHSFWQAPVGSGPYRVKETVMGQYSILERWEEYRLEGAGNIRLIHMAASGETDGDLVLRADLDQLDYAWGKSPDDAASVAQTDGMKVTPIQIPYLRCFYINQFPHESYNQQDPATE